MKTKEKTEDGRVVVRPITNVEEFAKELLRNVQRAAVQYVIDNLPTVYFIFRNDGISYIFPYPEDDEPPHPDYFETWEFMAESYVEATLNPLTRVESNPDEVVKGLRRCADIIEEGLLNDCA